MRQFTLQLDHHGQPHVHGCPQCHEWLPCHADCTIEPDMGGVVRFNELEQRAMEYPVSAYEPCEQCAPLACRNCNGPTEPIDLGRLGEWRFCRPCNSTHLVED